MKLGNFLKFAGTAIGLVGFLLVFGSVEPDPSLTVWGVVRVAIFGFALMFGGYWVFLWGEEFSIPKEEKKEEKKEVKKEVKKEEEKLEIYDAM